MKKYFKKGLFDRSDGWKITNIDPMMKLTPYFMRTRLDSQNLYEQTVNIPDLSLLVR